MPSADILVHAFLISCGAAVGAAVLALTARQTDPDDRLGTPFVWQSLISAGYFFATAAYYSAGSLSEAIATLKAQVYFVVPAVGVAPWCFARISDQRLSRTETVSLVGSAAVLLVANALSSASLRFQTLAEAARTVLPNGERYVTFQGAPGGWAMALRLFLVLVLALILRRVPGMWRRGERALSWCAIVVSALLAIASVFGLLVDLLHLRFGYVASIPVLLGMIATLGVAIGISRHRRREQLMAADAELRASNAALQAHIVERARLERRLIETQRMEALGRMAAGVAHDFNNLITVLRGHADLLIRGTEGSPGLRQSAEEIGQAADSASGLTRQLLAFARRQALAPRPLDVDRAIAEVSTMLRPLVGGDVQLELAPGAGGRPILADPTQFSQVLMNLAANARDAMPRGGRLRLATTAVDTGAPGVCACEGALGGEHVCLTVADTGSGMDAETLARAFEPFFTTRSNDGGTGLGLATVHGIVRQSGGFIAVASQPGTGTTFRICWPAAPRPGAAPPRPSSGAVTRL